MSKKSRKPGIRAENSTEVIGQRLGMTRQNAEYHINTAVRKIGVVHKATDYNRVRNRAASMVMQSVEHAIKHDDFIATLTNKLTFWMLNERHELAARR